MLNAVVAFLLELLYRNCATHKDSWVVFNVKFWVYYAGKKFKIILIPAGVDILCTWKWKKYSLCHWNGYYFAINSFYVKQNCFYITCKIYAVHPESYQRAQKCIYDVFTFNFNDHQPITCFKLRETDTKNFEPLTLISIQRDSFFRNSIFGLTFIMAKKIYNLWYCWQGFANMVDEIFVQYLNIIRTLHQCVRILFSSSHNALKC